MSWLDKLAQPEDIRRLRSGIPYYEENRERVGVLIHKGFTYYDKYEKNKPYIFWSSITLAGISGFLWWNRRKMHAEAHVLYPATFLASSVTAYITRPIMKEKVPPGTLPPPAPGAPPPTPQESEFMRWIEQERQRLKTEDPDFADKAFDRLVKTPPIDQTWNEVPGYAQALLI